MINFCEKPLLSNEDLPIMLKHFPISQKNKSFGEGQSLSLRRNMEKLEKELIVEALNVTNGNIKRAAMLLEVPRQTLQYKIKKIFDS